MTDIRSGYKVLTHHLCSPIQGGAPIVTGPLPFTLPTVALDTSGAECAAGWNFTAEPETALRLGGLWPTGRPSRLFLVEASADAIERRNKRRASALMLVREATDEEIGAAIERFSAVFGEHQAYMTAEQRAWRSALRRPRRDAAAVEDALVLALRTRGLEWKLKRYATAWDARDARDAWAAWAARDARAAWAARAAWDARDARDAWAAWAARAAWDAWDARAAWAARAAWDARDARDAWAALTVACAGANKWTKEPPEYLTAGLREAYDNGLGVAIPTLPKVLGWAMDDEAA